MTFTELQAPYALSDFCNYFPPSIILSAHLAVESATLAAQQAKEAAKDWLLKMSK